MCEDAVQMFGDFSFEFGGFGFRTLGYVVGIVEAGEEMWLGWVGEIVARRCGGYCAGNSPAVEFSREVIA